MTSISNTLIALLNGWGWLIALLVVVFLAIFLMRSLAGAKKLTFEWFGIKKYECEAKK